MQTHPESTGESKPARRCTTVGIAGGIGSGKSVVSRICRLRGLNVYDCDMEAKRIMDTSTEIRTGIAERLGAEYIAPDGSICRKVLAARLFSDSEARKWINSVVHSAVYRDFQALAMRSEGILLVESALLRSSGLYRLCDRIWIVDAPVEIRLERVRKRNGLSDSEILRRMESQRHELEFPASTADITDYITNDGVSPIAGRVDNLLLALNSNS